MAEKGYPCPSCGFIVFDSPGGWEICPICDWEDDPVQMINPNMQGGANRICLWEAQQKILKNVPLSMHLHQGYQRDPKWRPLTEDEARNNRDIPKSGRDYFDAILYDTFKYYWEK